MIFNTQSILLFLLICCFSCSEIKTERAGQAAIEDIVNENHFLINSVGDSILTGVPIPIQGKQLNVSEPRVVPFTGEPKEIPFNRNIIPAGKPKLNQNVKPPSIRTPGVNGLSLPKVVPAVGQIVNSPYPKPVPALAPKMKESALVDIQYMDIDRNLSNNSLWTVLEDSQGNLWLGSMGSGVSRYDGTNFTHFTTKNGLSSDYIFSMLEDKDGNMWFGTREGGVSRYDGTNFTHFTTQGGLSHNFVLSILEDSQGNLWFGTLSGLNHYDGNNFTQYSSTEGLEDNEVISLFEDSQQNIWIGTGSGSGIQSFDGQKFTHYNIGDGIGSNDAHSIIEDREGNLWFGTWGGGVSKFDGKQFSKFTQDDGLLGDAVLSVLEDQEGNFWFGCMGGGVTMYDGTHFTHYTSEEGLSSNSIRMVIEDKQANIWACTWDSGLNRINKNGFKHYNQKSGFGGSSISTSVVDQQGDIWFGGNSSNALKKLNESSHLQYSSQNSIIQNGIQTLVEGEPGHIWIGTAGQGIIQFNGKSFREYTKDQNFLPNDFRSSFKDSQGNIWFGTQGHGIIKYNGELFTQFSQREGFANNDVYAIFEDSKGYIWFGTLGAGVSRYDGQNFIYYTSNEGLNSDFVYAIAEDSKGHLWIGTDEGLNRYDGADITSYSSDNGFTDNSALSITVDQSDNIWVSFAKGINLLSPPSNSSLNNNETKTPSYHFFNFTPNDGLIKANFTYGAIQVDQKNQIWFPGMTGFKVLDLNQFKLPDSAPKNVHLSQIDINQEYQDYRLISTTPNTSKLKFDSVVAFNNYPLNLVLPHDQNHLTFHFSALDLKAPHKIQYSFWIEGVDSHWSLPQSEPKIDYRNLKPGKYTLKVRAIGEANIWSEPFFYTFTITPPWWLTWWAKSIYALALMGVLYLARIYELRKQKQKLEEQQRINKVTSKFVPTAFLQSLGRKDIMEVQLGDSVEQETTVLFSDIRDFTTLSEMMTPEENFQFVNSFNKKMGPIIQKNGGFVNQYLGDAIMALFKTSPLNALQAAVQMQIMLAQYNEERIAKHRQFLRMGIGFHTGPLIMGIIGDDHRMDATTISDSVNTAARIESLGKYFKTNILLSGESLKQIKAQQQAEEKASLNTDFNFRFLGKVQLKGKTETVEIYECIDGDSPEMINKKLASQSMFKKGMTSYLSKDFKGSLDAFDKVITINQNDFPAQVFRQKSSDYLSNGVPEDWTGVEVMSFK